MIAPDAGGIISHLVYDKQLFLGQAPQPKRSIERQGFSGLDLKGISVHARN
jgi:hypothetical protein